MPVDQDQKTVLIIDDDREIASMLQGVLQNAGHRVFHAINGVEGQKQIESLKPDLVITDMMMPRLGGFPVLEFLRTLENPPKVIMITANEGGRHKAYAEMLGVSDYLRKPFPMEALLESVRRIFNGPAPLDEEANPIRKSLRKKPSKSSDETES
ncbi:MAG: response regulator [Planctomycetes bacterium]|nr:response regulator [Planctomycetota bacterium]